MSVWSAKKKEERKKDSTHIHIYTLTHCVALNVEAQGSTRMVFVTSVMTMWFNGGYAVCAVIVSLRGRQTTME
jgi:hypothetical protein